MKTMALCLLLSSLLLPAMGQYKYGLKPTGYDAYLQSLKSHPEKELVNLEEFIPGIVLDIRYATTNNFTHEQIYDRAAAYARRPVAEALKKVQEELRPQGLGIKIFDGYRPYKATVKFYEVYGDSTYVASPYSGSRHNRGCALDLTLIDLNTGRELKMPTGYDAFTKKAWPSTPVADAAIRMNRQRLINIMEDHGFKVSTSEWWHFDFTGWQKYEVMDIDFDKLN